MLIHCASPGHDPLDLTCGVFTTLHTFTAHPPVSMCVWYLLTMLCCCYVCIDEHAPAVRGFLLCLDRAPHVL